MGWIAAIVGIASVAGGVYQNSQQNKFNQNLYNQSREDYAMRLKLAAEGAKLLGDQYNKVQEERPDLTWEGYVGELVKALKDPRLLEAYHNAKQEDFNVLRKLAETASDDNTKQFQKTFDQLSHGKGDEIVDQRNKLVLEDDTAQRYARALELRSPSIGAGTVKYDSKGQLVEGQRADKAVFDTAYETVVETNRERKADLRALEGDRSTAAQSQQEKAKNFMGFYDYTGYSTANFDNQRKQQLEFQMRDEERAFELYKLFAAGSAGIVPSQPGYVSPTGGNELISSGTKLVGSALGNYYSNNNKPKGRTGTYS